MYPTETEQYEDYGVQSIDDGYGAIYTDDYFIMTVTPHSIVVKFLGTSSWVDTEYNGWKLTGVSMSDDAAIISSTIPAAGLILTSTMDSVSLNWAGVDFNTGDTITIEYNMMSVDMMNMGMGERK